MISWSVFSVLLNLGFLGTMVGVQSKGLGFGLVYLGKELDMRASEISAIHAEIYISSVI